MYIKRHLEQVILKLSKNFSVILLTGPRQVGKTTLLQHLRKKTGHAYVSLDEFEMRSSAKRDPGLFLEQFGERLIIDEIQYALELLPYIKTRVDRSPGKYSYWLTGSQYFHLMRGVSESLSGRVAILKLPGFSWAEEKGLPLSKQPWRPEQISLKKKYPEINLKELFRKILRGSFPKLLNMEMHLIESFYGSYVQTYIDRDLRDLVRVGSLASFEKFIRICAARTAQIINLSDFARDSDISVNTAKEWLSILEASGIIYFLRPYYRNITKRLIKMPKLYFLDTGLVCYLTGWKTPETAMRGAMAGALFETFIFSEILKNYWNHGIEAPLWFYRTKEKEEIDILIERNGKLYPVEIKLSSRITENDLKGIKSISRTGEKLGTATFITASPSPYWLTKGIAVLPYTALQNF